MNAATLITAGIHGGGCSFDGAQVCDNICTNSQFQGNTFLTTYFSIGTYLDWGIAVAIIADAMCFALFFLMSVLDTIPHKGLAGVLLFFVFVPPIYILIFLICASANGSMGQWRDHQPVLYPMMIVWTTFTLVYSVFAAVMIPIEYVRVKNNYLVINK